MRAEGLPDGTPVVRRVGRAGEDTRAGPPLPIVDAAWQERYPKPAHSKNGRAPARPLLGETITPLAHSLAGEVARREGAERPIHEAVGALAAE